MTGDEAHIGSGGKVTGAPSEPTLLEYSDQPPGSRLEVTRDGGQLVIVDPPPGFGWLVVQMLLPMLVYVAFVIAVVMLLWHKFPAGSATAPWRQILLRMFTPNAELLTVFGVISAVAYFTCWRSLMFTLTADRLIVTTCLHLWGQRRWSTRREIPRSAVSAVRSSRFGSRVIILQQAPAKPRTLAWAIFAGRADAKWIVRTVCHELGIKSDGSEPSIGQSTDRKDVVERMDPFLRAAIDEAKQGLAEGGLPIGSVLVRGDQVIARGHNRRVQHGEPMAHAEIDCLTRAGRQKTYKDTVLYSTLMPCYLCTGAVVQFGIPQVIVGESVTFPGGEGKWGRSPDFMRANGVEVIDLSDPECIDMMRTFIREHPELWNEDIGVD